MVSEESIGGQKIKQLRCHFGTGPKKYSWNAENKLWKNVMPQTTIQEWAKGKLWCTSLVDHPGIKNCVPGLYNVKKRTQKADSNTNKMYDNHQLRT